MKVLGIATEGDSGAAIIEDGKILAAVNEERFWRECILLHGLYLRLSQKDSAHMSNKHTMMFSGIDAKCVSLTMYIDG